MAHLSAQGDDLVVQLSPLEKLGAFRGDVRVPLRTVRSLFVTEKPWGQLRGIRTPGTGFPGVIALGTRRGHGIKDFAAVYGMRTAIVVELKGACFGRLIVSVRDHSHTLERIAAAVRHAPRR